MYDDHSSERWLPVVESNGLFSVSDAGMVRNDKTGLVFLPKPHKGHGYRTIWLGRTNRYLHVAIAEAFIGPKPPGHDVDHINRDKADNRLVNLRYVSRSQNTMNSIRAGCGKGGMRIPLSDWQSVADRYSAGETMSQIASSYGVNHCTISKLLTKRKAGVPYSKAKRTTKWIDVPDAPSVQRMFLFS